jgi:hypothetical protein
VHGLVSEVEAGQSVSDDRSAQAAKISAGWYSSDNSVTTVSMANVFIACSSSRA